MCSTQPNESRCTVFSHRRASAAIALSAAGSLLVATAAWASDGVSDGKDGLPVEASSSAGPQEEPPGEPENDTDVVDEEDGEGGTDDGASQSSDAQEEESTGEPDPEVTQEPSPEDSEEHANVLVCIASANPESPYSGMLAAVTAIINGEGKVKKGGPADSVEGVFPDEPWGNIVPPVTHHEGVSYDGFNWTSAGQAIWNDGCGPDVVVPPPHEHEMITVCIATPEGDQPYAVAEFSASKIVKGNGTVIVDGPADTVEGVFPDEQWGNIVPAFVRSDHADYPGANWTDAGQVIWGAECTYVVPPPPPPPPAPAPAPAPVAAEPVLLVLEPEAEPAPESEPLPVAVPLPAVISPVEQESVITAPVVVTLPKKATVPSSVPAGMAP
jgi:hypothetical protein